MVSLDQIDVKPFYSQCVQCPKQCKVDRENSLGFCRESSTLRMAFAGLHFGEEPLITVKGGSGTIFFTGCTLRCAFCQNYQISQEGYGKEVSVEEFAKVCLELQENGAENINLVTASHHIPLVAKGIYLAKKMGVYIPFCWNSSAYESTKMLELLKGLVTIWLPDLKTLNSELAKKLFHAPDYPEVATKAIKWMIANSPLRIKCEKENEKMYSGVIVRHLFMPGKFEETSQVLSWLKENADTKACISLMNQYTPVPFAKDSKNLKERKAALKAIENRLVTKEEDEDIQDLICAYDFEYLFYQELSNDTSWLPDFKKLQPFSNALAKPIWHA